MRDAPFGFRWFWLVVIGILACACVVLVALTAARSAEQSAIAEQYAKQIQPSEVTVEESATTVAFLGDSYTAGSDMDSGVDFRWPQLVSTTFGWTPLYFGVGGSGYIAPGQGKPFADRVDAIIRAKPDIVFVAGGINDAQTYSAGSIGSAARSVLERLRTGLPNAEIVVVGNFFQHKVSDVRVIEASDAIHNAQRSVSNTKWINPLPWFAHDQVEIGTDNTHPTDAGHKTIANDMTAALKKLGYKPVSS